MQRTASIEVVRFVSLSLRLKIFKVDEAWKIVL